MRPVRFVALSEDGQALVLADEVGRLLALPLDDKINGALRTERGQTGQTALGVAVEPASSLSPRDIQARIRAGESAEDVARVAGVPVDRVLRYAGPVLQERAMLAQHARRTKLKSSDKPASLAEVVDARLGQHGIDAEKISWDAYRRDDGTWRIVATWPSGKATAHAVWELDKTRQAVTPHDDMAQYLCADRTGQLPDPTGRHGHGVTAPSRGESSRGDLTRGDLKRGGLNRGDHGGHEPMRPPPAEAPRRESRPGRGLGSDPIRAGRDALLASLDRPLGAPIERETHAPAASATDVPKARGAAALIGRGPGVDPEPEPGKEIPAVPSLAVLRPRRTSAAAAEPVAPDKPRKRLPSWDDVLFGGTPVARETS
jgi:hypothetical protein